MMKKNDLILIGSFLVIALLAFGIYMGMHKSQGTQVQIQIDGSVYKTLSLAKDQTILIPSAGNHTNKLEIKNGYANMVDADCPDKLCVHQKKIKNAGESLVCLPHKVIVTVLSDSSKNDTPLDGVSQ